MSLCVGMCNEYRPGKGIESLEMVLQGAIGIAMWYQETNLGLNQ